MINNDSEAKPFISRLRGWIGVLGPGLITAALVFDPSKVTISSKMGAEYGYALLWVVVVAIFFMSIFTAMASRIGMATDQSFLTLVMIIGATISIVFGKLPISLMIVAQSVTILVVPFIGIAMYWIANDDKIMGEHKNSSTR